MELKVAMLKQIEMASLAGDYMNMTSSAQLKVSYELAIEKNGENAETTILAGVVYSLRLDIKKKSTNLNSSSQSCPPDSEN